MMMKHPRLSSEKNITTSWGMRWACSRQEEKKRMFIAGFQWLNPYPLGNSAKR